MQRLGDQTRFVVNDDERQGKRDLHGAVCKGKVKMVLTSLSLVPFVDVIGSFHHSTVIRFPVICIINDPINLGYQ